MGYLDTVYGMVKKCKFMAGVALEGDEKQMERERRGGIVSGSEGGVSEGRGEMKELLSL